MRHTTDFLVLSMIKNSAMLFVAASLFLVSSYGQTQVRLTASDLARLPQAGKPIAISGNTVVVGALAGGGDDSGAAYVFEQDEAGAWARTAKLLPIGAVPGERFGASVAISHDTVVVGAGGGR